MILSSFTSRQKSSSSYKQVSFAALTIQIMTTKEATPTDHLSILQAFASTIITSAQEYQSSLPPCVTRLSPTVIVPRKLMWELSFLHLRGGHLRKAFRHRTTPIQNPCDFWGSSKMDMADRRGTSTSEYCTQLVEMLVHTESNTLSDTSSGLNRNLSALVDRHPSYQPAYQKQFEPKIPSGSKACDPITVSDDDDPDAAEITYIDLENVNEAPAKGSYTASIKQNVAGTPGLRCQSVTKNPSPYNNIQGPNLTMHTKRVTQPLFRALPKDDFPTLTIQTVSENHGIGFKAWYGTHGSNHTENTIREMQHKAISRTPSIASYNEERTKNTTRKDRDAPQFEMSVLNSKRKRTIGELKYDELISPAQIESPSEKLARVAKKRRQRQKKCDHLSQNINVKDAQSAMSSDPAYGHGNDRVTEQNGELAVSPIARGSLVRQETLSNLPEVGPATKNHASSSYKKSKLDELKSPVEHRATAGKGLSQETLKKFQETGDWNRSIKVDQDVDEAQDKETKTELPEIAYRYFVQKREWLETEGDAIESTLGPYHTMNEANAVAKAEVQSPQIDGFEGVRSKGWSYLYEQDEFGMQTHTATILEIHIETAVHRGKCHFVRLVPQWRQLIRRIF